MYWGSCTGVLEYSSTVLECRTLWIGKLRSPNKNAVWVKELARKTAISTAQFVSERRYVMRNSVEYNNWDFPKCQV